MNALWKLIAGKAQTNTSGAGQRTSSPALLADPDTRARCGRNTSHQDFI